MGSALLTDPDRLESILTALVANIPIPISCKIRLISPSNESSFLDATNHFVQRMQSTGISALAVHCRFTHEKPREPGHWEIFEFLADKMKIPLIANGDLFTQSDLHRLKESKWVDSFMLARAAQWNPSVFRKEGLLPISEVMLEYVKLSKLYDMHYKNAKYTLTHMQIQGKDGIVLRENLNSCKSMDEILYVIEKFQSDRNDS